jgi:hypothetical protein
MVDEYSLAALPIVLAFGETSLSTATAFVWQQGDEYYLVTNWHNFSGWNAQTGANLSRHGGRPDRVGVHMLYAGPSGTVLGQKVLVVLPLKDDENKPLWWVHPAFGWDVDIAVLPIATEVYLHMRPINRMRTVPMRILMGSDVFVLGYPLSIAAPLLMPIWKRASLASEPDYRAREQPFLIDTATRKGMSGSPVIARNFGPYIDESTNMTIMGAGVTTRAIGIYSGA